MGSEIDEGQTELAPRQAAELARGGAQLVDVREADEHAAGHIEGSTLIELNRLSDSADAIERERPVLFYCRTGARSGLATQAFRAAGYDAYNLAGGMVAWTGAGLPIAPADGRVI